MAHTNSTAEPKAPNTETSTSCSAKRLAGYSFVSCSRKGVIDRAGAWYCRQHDPEAITQRANAREQKWKTERDARSALYATGKILTARLGVGHVQILSNVRAVIVLDFEDVQRIVEALGK